MTNPATPYQVNPVPVPQNVAAPTPMPMPAPSLTPQAVPAGVSPVPVPVANPVPQPAAYGIPSPVPAQAVPQAMPSVPNVVPAPQGLPASVPPMPAASELPAIPPVTPQAGADAIDPLLAQATSPYVEPAVDMSREGGEKALPAIAIQAFCERSDTAGCVHEMSRDWRMKRTNLEIYMGGLPAAIDYYRKESTPSLILVETGLHGGELFNQLDELASVCDEGTQVVIIGAANDIKLYRQLMEAGVSEYIVPPLHPLNLIRSLSDLFSDPEKPFVGRVAAFFGVKGGVGSSTLAHNIAWCMSEELQQETSLVDLDSSWGTTGLDFAYDATEGLEQALADIDRLDETLLDRLMLRHTPKLSILSAASSLNSDVTMSPEAYETVVNCVRGISPMTILDMPHYWSAWSRNVLTNADDVVIVATPDLANLRNAKNLVDYLKAQRPNDAEPILILNKTGVSKNNEISVKDFGAAVGLEPALVIGYDAESFIEASNDGKMLTEVKGTAQMVAGFNYIAHRLRTGTFPAPVASTNKGKFSLSGLDPAKLTFLSKLKKGK